MSEAYEQEKIRPYEGSDPYVFVSYSHANEGSVLPTISALQSLGYRVWYDAGIEGGSIFTTRIGVHVDSCAGMIAFLSPAYAESWWCQDEVQLAYEQRKHILPVILEDVELVDPLRFHLRRFQRERRDDYASDEDFIRALVEAPFMASCLRKPIREARRALTSPILKEENLYAAVMGLQSLPDADRDEGVDRLEAQLKEQLHQLRAGRREDGLQKASEWAGCVAEEEAMHTAPKEEAYRHEEEEHGLNEAKVAEMAELKKRELQIAKEAVLQQRMTEEVLTAESGEWATDEACGELEQEQREEWATCDDETGDEGLDMRAVAIVILVVLAIIFVAVRSHDGSQSGGSISVQSDGGDQSMKVNVSESSDDDQTTESVTDGLTYSWAELKTIANEIAAADSDEAGLEIAKSKGLVDSNDKLNGDTKTITLTDGTECSVRIAGFRHDDKSDGSGKAGITFEFADNPKTHSVNASADSSGGWEQSEMRSWLNSNFYNMLPDDLKPNIVEVTKRTNNKGFVYPKDYVSAVSDTDDKLWLLAVSEVYGDELAYSNGKTSESLDAYKAEGTQYKLYEDQGVTISNCSFCVKSGAHSIWWLRSPRAGLITFCYVHPNGEWAGLMSADRAYGVSPGFCL